jgi:outer membrane autotransporter protein
MPGCYTRRNTALLAAGVVATCTISVSERSAYAACDNPAPNTGQAVTCSGPVPDTAGVTAVPGSTGVTVLVQPGATIDTFGINAITLSDQSQATNQGAISTTSDNADGMAASGGGNTLTNDVNATIATSGTAARGMISSGSGNTIVNKGSIETTGDNSTGLVSDGTSNVFTNLGSVTTGGTISYGMLDSSAGANTWHNNGSINTTGPQSNGIYLNGAAGSSVESAGSIETSGTSSSAVLVNGDNNTIVNSGTVMTSGTTSDGMASNGTGNLFTNTGSITTTGQFSRGFLDLDHGNSWVNSGSITTTGASSPGIALATNTGSNAVNSGTIFTSGDGSDGILAGGDGNILRNDGIITATGPNAVGVHLVGGNGNSSFTNTGTVNGGILGQSGFDTVNLLSGTINGDIVIDRGVVEIATGVGVSGSIHADGNSRLQLKGSGSSSLASAISDFTFFDKLDDGAWTLTGPISGGTAVELHSGTLTLDGNNSYTGQTVIDAGTLFVNGTIASSTSLLVNPGGTIGGVGILPSTVVNGGTIAPGNSIGTLTVSGDLVLEGGAVYRAEIDEAGRSDLILVSGTTTIGTASVDIVNAAPVFLLGMRYTILTADGGVSGTFSNPVQHLPLVDLALTYDPNNVYFEITRNEVPIDAVVPLPDRAIADAVQELGAGNPVFEAVVGQTTDDAIRYALDQLSGQDYASIRSAMIDDSRFVRDAINNRLGSGFGNAMTSGDTQQRRFETGGVAWLSGFGSWASRDGTSDANGLDRSIGGFLVGGDVPLDDNIIVGAAAGYSSSRYDFDGVGTHGDSDNYYAALYSGLYFGNWAIRTGAAYSWQKADVTRNVAFPGFSDDLSADYSAGTAQIFGEAGYKIELEKATLEPFAGAAWVNLDTDGFTEKNGPAALAVDGSHDNVGITTVGLRASTQFELGGKQMSARGMAGWRHAFGDVDPMTSAAFASGTSSFGAGGLPVAENVAVIEIGFDANLSSSTKFGLTYSGQFGNRVSDNGLSARLTAKF